MAVGTLTVDMNARLASFERDLGRSVAIAKRNADQLEKSFSNVSGVLKGLGTVIGIREIVQMGRALVDAAADLDDLAEKTGASVESLSKLQQVARNTGIPISDVEELVIRFNKALAGSDDEAKGAAVALEQLGLQASELRGLDRAEAVIKFARALDQFTDSGGKADVILGVLKRGGEQYAPLLKEIAQAGELQASVTAKQAAEAEVFQKQLAALGEAIRGAAQALTMDFLPGIIGFINEVTAASKAAGGLYNALKVFAGETLGNPGKAIAKLDEEIGHYKDKIRETQDTISASTGLSGMLDPLRKQDVEIWSNEIARLEDKRQKLIDFRNIERGLNAPRDESGKRDLVAVPPPRKEKAEKRQKLQKAEKPDNYVADVFEDSLEAIAKFREAYLSDVQQLISGTDTGKLDEIAAKLEFARNAFEANDIKSPEVFEQIVEQLKEAERAAQPANAQLDRLNEILQQTDSAKLEKARADMMLLADAFNRGAESAEFGRMSLQEYEEAVNVVLGRTTDRVAESANELSAVGIAIQGIASDASAAFVEILFSGENTFKKLVETALKELARLVIYQSLLGPLAAGISGGLSGIGFGAGMAGFQGRASGGSVSAGMPYWVGEKGKEIMVPHSSGTIIPNNEIRNSGGNSITVVVNSGRDTQQRGSGSNQNLAKFARQMGALMDQKLIEAQRPGGQLY